MRLRPAFRWPPGKAQAMRRAERLEIATLVFMATVVAVMFLALGSSQAMRTAWIEDILGLVPASAFLVARHFEKKPPARSFPFGYFKAISIAYLVASTALLILALYMIYDSGAALVGQVHPTIGLVSVFGHDVWLGWLMIAALVYSIIPPVILGRMKKAPARELHDNVLLADSTMQAADWMTAAAAIIGIIGVGFGLWWADAVAAIAIALNVLNDGRTHVVKAISELAAQIPQALGRDEQHPAIAAVRTAVLALDWVEEVEVRLRSEGRLITGSILVRPQSLENLSERLAAAHDAAVDAHWRVHDPVVSVLRR